MQGETKARWLRLCEQAAVEQDPAKLLERVKQINDLLSEKQQTIQQRKSTNETDPVVASTAFPNRILLADDSRAVRTAFKEVLLQQNSAWEISEAENGPETVEKAAALQPALVLLDLNLPDMPGSHAAQQIRKLSTATKIIICSFNDSAHLAAMAEHLGADGYFPKGADPDDLLKTVAVVLNSTLAGSDGNSSVQ